MPNPLCFIYLVLFLPMLPLQSAPSAAWDDLPAHPYLFARPADWDQLRQRITADPVSARLFATIRANADALLEIPPVALVKEGRRLLLPIRSSQGRIFILAMTARLTEDPRYARRAIDEMLHLAAAPDLNPSHFLDTAEAALALGTGYDWLHENLTPAERTLIEDAIISKALIPSFATPDGKPLWWITGHNNWNQVCHGGLTAGAVAIAKRDPELARRVVDRAIANLHHSAAAYGPDGSYPEGPSYWGYGTTFHVLLIEALRTALGTTAALDAFPGFLASADYIQQVTTPTGRFYAYSDNTDERQINPVLFWFARRLGRPDLTRTDIGLLLDGASARVGTESDRFLPFALLWNHPTLPVKTGTAPLNWFSRGLNPLGVHRSAWDDPHAVYLALKGGSPSVSHGHMDVGSFLIEADGVTWAVDTGKDNYNSIESAGIDLWSHEQDSQRWQVFRDGPESHNIIRFDDGPQIANASAKPNGFRSDGEAPFTRFELTPLYAGQVASVHRGASLRADRRIVLQDEWTALPDKSVEVAWQWLTRADATVNGTTLALRQDSGSLHIRVLEPVDARIEVVDVSAPHASYDAPNPGLKSIVVHTRTKAGASGRIIILVTPGTISPDLPAPEIRSLSEW